MHRLQCAIWCVGVYLASHLLLICGKAFQMLSPTHFETQKTLLLRADILLGSRAPSPTLLQQQFLCTPSPAPSHSHPSLGEQPCYFLFLSVQHLLKLPRPCVPGERTGLRDTWAGIETRVSQLGKSKAHLRTDVGWRTRAGLRSAGSQARVWWSHS